jgi:hypothetical protein
MPCHALPCLRPTTGSFAAAVLYTWITKLYTKFRIKF